MNSGSEVDRSTTCGEDPIAGVVWQGREGCRQFSVVKSRGSREEITVVDCIAERVNSACLVEDPVAVPAGCRRQLDSGDGRGVAMVGGVTELMNGSTRFQHPVTLSGPAWNEDSDWKLRSAHADSVECADADRVVGPAASNPLSSALDAAGPTVNAAEPGDAVTA